MLLSGCGEMCYLNKLLMVSVLGWLFQVRNKILVFVCSDIQCVTEQLIIFAFVLESYYYYSYV